MPKYKAFIASSTNPDEVANTVKGIVLALASVITIVGASFFHINLTATDIATLAGNLGLAAGAIWTLYGLVMKLVAYFGKAQQ